MGVSRLDMYKYTYVYKYIYIISCEQLKVLRVQWSVPPLYPTLSNGY